VAKRERAHRPHYARTGVGLVYDLAPLSVESFGRPRRPTMGLLLALVGVAASSGGFALVTSPLRRHSVALCTGHGRMYGESIFTLARANGRALQPGMFLSVVE
jgi:hypothetical protein